MSLFHVKRWVLGFLFTSTVSANPLEDVRGAAQVAFDSLYRTPELVLVEKPASQLPPSHAWRRIVLIDVACEPSILVKLRYSPDLTPHTWIDVLNYKSRFLVEKSVTFRRTVDRVTIADGLEKDGECHLSDHELLLVFREALAESVGPVAQ
jgi:hypothetical protein